MGFWHLKSKRKATGGLLTLYRKTKRKFEKGGEAIKTTIGAKQLKKRRTVGGNDKAALRYADFANIVDPKTKKHKKVKITAVIENKASAHFVRQGVITKGAIIKTEAGEARVTSRPGQDGVVNAVLVK